MISKDYSFQTDLKKKVYSSLVSQKSVVLAAAPGSGKTRMAIDLISRFLKDHPGARILCLTHGMTFLRTQWQARLAEANPDFEYKVLTRFNKNKKLSARVFIALPQTLKNGLNKKIDLLVVDEAHHFYFSGMVQGIIKHTRPKHQLLLTGTPSVYVDDPRFVIHGITLFETLKYGTTHNPIIELADYAYDQSLKDYQNLDLRKLDSITAKATDETMDELLRFIVEKISLRKNSAWRETCAALQKTMIACASIKQASLIHKYLSKHGIDCAVSTSGHSGKGIDHFIQASECRILIVVNRGVLGFDYAGLMNVIDLTGSLNPNRIFQLLCRIVRHPEISGRKMFIKMSSQKLRDLTHHAMSFTVAMALPEFYFFKHDKINKIQIPQIFNYKHKGSGAVVATLPDVSHLPKLNTFLDIVRNQHRIGSYAKTDFETVRSKVASKTWPSFAEILQKARGYRSYSEFKKVHKDLYKYLQRNGQLVLLKEVFPHDLGDKEYHNGKFERPKFSRKEIVAIMRKCKSRMDMKERFLKAYKDALRKHKDLFDKHFPIVRWSPEKLQALAKSEKENGCWSINEFARRHQGADSAIRYYGLQHIFRELWPHEQRYHSVAKWEKQEVLALVQTLPKMSTFKRNHSGAHSHALRNGYINEIRYIFLKKQKAQQAQKESVEAVG